MLLIIYLQLKPRTKNHFKPRLLTVNIYVHRHRILFSRYTLHFLLSLHQRLRNTFTGVQKNVTNKLTTLGGHAVCHFLITLLLWVTSSVSCRTTSARFEMEWNCPENFGVICEGAVRHGGGGQFAQSGCEPVESVTCNAPINMCFPSDSDKRHLTKCEAAWSTRLLLSVN